MDFFKKHCTLLLLTLIVVTGMWSEVLADPNDSDVTVYGWNGAPGCTAVDGNVLITNDSGTYDYKVAIVATAVNDENAPPACAGEECFALVCQCQLNYTAETYGGDVRRRRPGAQAGMCSSELWPAWLHYRLRQHKQLQSRGRSLHLRYRFLGGDLVQGVACWGLGNDARPHLSQYYSDGGRRELPNGQFSL